VAFLEEVSGEAAADALGGWMELVGVGIRLMGYADLLR